MLPTTLPCIKNFVKSNFMFVQTIEEEVPEFIAIFAISFGCGFKISWTGGHKKHTICLNLFSFYSLNMRKRYSITDQHKQIEFNKAYKNKTKYGQISRI